MPKTLLASVLVLVSVAACSKGEAPVVVDNTPVIHNTTIPDKVPKDCSGGFYSYHYEKALKTLREVEDFRTGKRDYYVHELSDRRNEYLLAGISPRLRADWISSHKVKEKDMHCVMPLFEAIHAAAKSTLPKYQPHGYTHHDGKEEDLMKEAVKAEIPDAQFIAVGVKSPSWMIEKHYNGIPSLRYKYGMAWVKSATFDDGYCRIMYVNILQDYDGTGYADSRANYISMEPAGCD